MQYTPRCGRRSTGAASSLGGSASQPRAGGLPSTTGDHSAFYDSRWEVCVATREQKQAVVLPSPKQLIHRLNAALVESLVALAVILPESCRFGSLPVVSISVDSATARLISCICRLPRTYGEWRSGRFCSSATSTYAGTLTRTRVSCRSV